MLPMKKGDRVSYRIPDSKIIHEVFDDEVIACNLDRGHYYSIDDSGAEIWRLLLAGSTVPEMAEHFSNHDPSNRETIASGIQQFVDRLLEEGLIAPADNGAGKLPAENLPLTRRTVFTPPVLQKYTDMETLLRLDPIHEVDETGWPNAKKQV